MPTTGVFLFSLGDVKILYFKYFVLVYLLQFYNIYVIIKIKNKRLALQFLFKNEVPYDTTKHNP